MEITRQLTVNTDPEMIRLVLWETAGQTSPFGVFDYIKLTLIVG